MTRYIASCNISTLQELDVSPFLLNLLPNSCTENPSSLFLIDIEMSKLVFTSLSFSFHYNTVRGLTRRTMKV